MWIEKIVLICLIVLAAIGTITLAIIMHEYSHFSDYKVMMNITDGKICGLVLPTKWVSWDYLINSPAGYYDFEINGSDSSQIKEYQYITKDSEIKAYIISAIVLIFFTFCYMTIILSIAKDKQKISNQEEERQEKDFYIKQLEDYILRLQGDDEADEADEDYNNNDTQ